MFLLEVFLGKDEGFFKKINCNWYKVMDYLPEM